MKTYTLTLTARQLGGLKQWLIWMPPNSHPSDLRLRDALLAQIETAKKAGSK